MNDREKFWLAFTLGAIATIPAWVVVTAVVFG